MDKLQAAEKFNKGFGTSEYLAAALLDQAWHRLVAGRGGHRCAAFEAEALAAARGDPAVPPRYRSTYFAHVFSGGYSAGYYSYIWSEVLDADTVEWFKENGGLTRENGDRFRRTLLVASAGRRTRWRRSASSVVGIREIEPLLNRRGLEV